MSSPASLTTFEIQGVPKKATIQIQISALIQTAYCSALKFIIAFERRIRKNTQFNTHGTSF